jgi:hypothetical protein
MGGFIKTKKLYVVIVNTNNMKNGATMNTNLFLAYTSDSFVKEINGFKNLSKEANLPMLAFLLDMALLEYARVCEAKNDFYDNYQSHSVENFMSV